MDCKPLNSGEDGWRRVRELTLRILDMIEKRLAIRPTTEELPLARLAAPARRPEQGDE